MSTVNRQPSYRLECIQKFIFTPNIFLNGLEHDNQMQVFSFFTWKNV